MYVIAVDSLYLDFIGSGVKAAPSVHTAYMIPGSQPVSSLHSTLVSLFIVKLIKFSLWIETKLEIALDLPGLGV